MSLAFFAVAGYSADTKDKKDKEKKPVTFDITPSEMLEKLKKTAPEELKPDELEWSRNLYPSRYRPLSMEFNEKEIQKSLELNPDLKNNAAAILYN